LPPPVTTVVVGGGDRVEASDINRLRKFDGIISHNAEVTAGAHNFGLAKQELHCSEIAGSPVDRHGLRHSDLTGRPANRDDPFG